MLETIWCGIRNLVGKSVKTRTKGLFPPVPVEGTPAYDNSISSMCDQYYKVPENVVRFMDMLQARLPRGYTVKPWTINMAVTVFYPNGSGHVITYDGIENSDCEWLVERTLTDIFG